MSLFDDIVKLNEQILNEEKEDVTTPKKTEDVQFDRRRKSRRMSLRKVRRLFDEFEETFEDLKEDIQSGVTKMPKEVIEERFDELEDALDEVKEPVANSVVEEFDRTSRRTVRRLFDEIEEGLEEIRDTAIEDPIEFSKRSGRKMFSDVEEAIQEVKEHIADPDEPKGSEEPEGSDDGVVEFSEFKPLTKAEIEALKKELFDDYVEEKNEHEEWVNDEPEQVQFSRRNRGMQCISPDDLRGLRDELFDDIEDDNDDDDDFEEPEQVQFASKRNSGFRISPDDLKRLRDELFDGVEDDKDGERGDEPTMFCGENDPENTPGLSEEKKEQIRKLKQKYFSEFEEEVKQIIDEDVPEKGEFDGELPEEFKGEEVPETEEQVMFSFLNKNSAHNTASMLKSFNRETPHTLTSLFATKNNQLK
jgi:hypothetical protein